jgi:hypothetical protein
MGTVAPWVRGLGILLMIGGGLVNLWSTLVIGLPRYFYRDLFMAQRSVDLKVVGPYRYFKNPELFGAFQRRGDDRSGLGLGLFISRRGVEANDGLLRVEDFPGHGCIFTIDLPRMITSTAALPEGAATGPSGGP